MKISELKPGASIELKATNISIQPIRKTWQCLECKKAGREPAFGLWKTEEEFRDTCPTCDAKETKEKGKGMWVQQVTSALIKDDTGMVYLDLWNKDTTEYKIGDNIHLISGYAKKKEKDGFFVSRGKYGSILKIEEE